MSEHDEIINRVICAAAPVLLAIERHLGSHPEGWNPAVTSACTADGEQTWAGDPRGESCMSVGDAVLDVAGL